MKSFVQNVKHQVILLSSSCGVAATPIKQCLTLEIVALLVMNNLMDNRIRGVWVSVLVRKDEEEGFELNPKAKGKMKCRIQCSM